MDKFKDSSKITLWSCIFSRGNKLFFPSEALCCLLTFCQTPVGFEDKHHMLYHYVVYVELCCYMTTHEDQTSIRICVDPHQNHNRTSTEVKTLFSTFFLETLTHSLPYTYNLPFLNESLNQLSFSVPIFLMVTWERMKQCIFPCHNKTRWREFLFSFIWHYFIGVRHIILKIRTLWKWKQYIPI